MRTDLCIGVIGIGYIGLPLAIKLAQEGFSVIGIDINPQIVKKLKTGHSTVEGIRPEWLKQVVGKTLKLLVVNKENPAATSERTLSKLIGVDVFVVCVPTPLGKLNEWEPDISHIQNACDLIERVCQIERKATRLPAERLLVLESTTYPGTTRKVFSPLLSKFEGAKRKWYLAYSPERTNPSPDAYDRKPESSLAAQSGEERIPGAFQITRIIGGKDKASREIGKAFYETIFDVVRPVRDIETAELTKLVENTFRFTSIAFANEITRMAKMLGLNGWEVIDAARSKNFGFELCFPGLIGGHCLPIDPHYLSSAIRSRRLAATFVDVAESEHQNMRREAFDLIQRLLNQSNKGVARASILFLGVAYKKNLGDIRESAAIKLMEQLYASGSRVTFWDPVRARHPAKPPIRLIFTREEYRRLPKKVAARLKWDDEKSKFYVEPKELGGDWETAKSRVLSRKFDCVVIATNHNEFKQAYKDLMLKRTPAIADLCNAIGFWLEDVKLRPNEKSKIKSKLAERMKYMLLGRH